MHRPHVALLAAVAIAYTAARPASAYIEVSYTLGRVVNESTTVVLMEVTKVNKEKGLVIYKKVSDLKGKHPTEEIKHNIGQRGFHAREWQNVMAWAEVGKKAVFFHNGGASETCIGNYWYQCYPEGEWWGMSHAEPYLLRTYCGDPAKLGEAVPQIVKGEEVVLPCMMDSPKEVLQERKAKLQRLKVSLKRLEYDAKRDFVSFGGEGEEIISYKITPVVAEGSADWKFNMQAAAGDWKLADLDDSKWRTGKAPIGYGEPEIQKRGGVTVTEQGQPFVFRRAVEIPADLLAQKNVSFRLQLAADDSTVVYLNGELIDQEADGTDHEAVYWNREIELEAKKFKPGKNVLAVLVRNKVGSSDIYFDLDLSAQIPEVKKPSSK